MAALTNHRHENFCQEVVKGASGARAYEAAGFKGTGATAEVNACKLLKRADINARIAEVRGEVTQRTELTLEALIEMGVGLFNAAQAAEDYSAASATYERLAKISGNWVDRAANLNITREVHTVHLVGPSG